MSQEQIELVQTPKGKGPKGYTKLSTTTLNSPGRSEQSLLDEKQPSSPPRIRLQEIPQISVPKREPRCKRSCRMYCTIASNNIKRKRCEFCLCLFSCLVVVVVTLLAKTVLENSSLIFLSLAQYESGQNDIILYQAGNRTEQGINYLNGTQMQDLIHRRLPHYKGSPRVTIPTSVICEGDCEYSKESQQITIRALNTKTQREIGVGTKFKFQEELNQGECLISSELARNYKLQEGDTAYLSTIISRYLEVLSSQYQYERQKKIQLNNTVFFDCLIVGIYSDQGGRQSENNKNIVYFEEAYLFKSLAPHFRVVSGDRDDFLDFIRSVNPEEYAHQFVIPLPRPRINYYLKSDFAEIQYQITQEASQLAQAVGPNQVAAWLSVLVQLNTISMSSVFFGIIVNLVIVLLAVLSIILITNLLLQSIQTKTAEIGTLRMLGVNKCDLFWILLSQALLFSMPALIVGFILSFPFLMIISKFFYDSVGYTFTPVPTSDAILMTIFLGLFIPAIAAMMPLEAALENTISNALNFSRSRTRGILINILNQSKAKILRSSMLGLLLVVFGGSVYYLLPYGFASKDYALLANVFFFLLIGMLLGFSLLALNFQHLLQVLLVRVFFCWQKAVIQTLILKNLVAHRLKNQKTSILYTLSIGFTIMIVAYYSMQMRQSQLIKLKSQGAQLTFQSQDIQTPLCVKCIFRAIRKHPQVVAGYSLNTFHPEGIKNKQIRSIVFGDKSGISNYKVTLHGITSNFFEPLVQDFLKINSRSTSKLSLQEQLYTAKGSQGFGSGIYLQDKTSISIYNYSETALLSLKYPDKRSFLELHPMWALNQAPNFHMADRHLGTQNIVVSIPSFRRMMGFSSVTQIPISGFYFKLKADISKLQIQEFIEDVQKSYPVKQMNRNVQIFDYQDKKDAVDDVQDLLNTIFTLVLVIVMLLCFFSLSGSMASNIYHQAKEIAILRAIGLTRKNIKLLYIYEAFVIVFSSGLQGLVIGVILGELLIIQQALFVDLPLQFYFPAWQLLAMFITSIFTAILASSIPAQALLSKQIAQIIRANV